MCAMVWERPGRTDELAGLVSELLELATEHGATGIQRFQRDDCRADADPAEMYVLRWQAPLAFERWRADQRVRSLVEDHRDVIASWQTTWVHEV